MVIVNLVGTSGSGKSTVVRELMKLDKFNPVFKEGRKAPLGYTYGCIFVLGAYEAASSSGCDTFGGDGRVPMLYGLVREWYKKGYHVIYEGITMMNHTRGIDLWNDTKALRVLYLQTDFQTCIDSITARRLAIGDTRPFGENLRRNLKTGYVRAENYCTKLERLGCPVFKVSRRQAQRKLLQVLEEN